MLREPWTKLPDWLLVPNKSNHRCPAYAATREATRRSMEVRDYVTKVVDLEEHTRLAPGRRTTN